jgi:hypothetical protein
MGYNGVIEKKFEDSVTLLQAEILERATKAMLDSD